MRHLAAFCFTLFIFFFGSTAAVQAANGIVLVAFGTSMESAKPALMAIEKSYKEHYPNTPIFWAYTSDIIRTKLAKEGKPVFSVYQALAECAKQGIDTVHVQSLHVSVGEEYGMLQRMLVRYLTKNPEHFKHLWLGHPLLESASDLDAVVKAVLAELKGKRQAGDALVLMGHGNDRGPADLSLAHVACRFQDTDDLAFVATVEGANSFDSVLEALKERKVKKVFLQPFMIVAGDHANNDLAGEEADSWASLCRAAGIEVEVHLEGLGSIAGVRELFLAHTKMTKDDLANPTKSD